MFVRAAPVYVRARVCVCVWGVCIEGRKDKGKSHIALPSRRAAAIHPFIVRMSSFTHPLPNLSMQLHSQSRHRLSKQYNHSDGDEWLQAKDPIKPADQVILTATHSVFPLESQRTVLLCYNSLLTLLCAYDCVGVCSSAWPCGW